MTVQKHNSIHLDANGDPDVRYYITQAHLMRGQAVHEGTVSFLRWIRNKLSHLLPHFHNPAAHH